MVPTLARRDLLAGLCVLAVVSPGRKSRAGGAEVAAVGHLEPPGVTLLDAARGGVHAVLPLAHEPAQLLIDGRRRHLLASDYDNGISVLSLVGDPAPRHRPLPFMPVHMQAAPGRALVAVNGLVEEGMWFLDPDRPEEAVRVRGLAEPHNFRFDRAARRLFVADRGGRGLALVDVARAERIAEIGAGAAAFLPVGAVPDGLALSPDGRRALLLFDGAERAVWLSLETGEARPGPALAGQPDRPRVDRRGRFFLVELPETGELLVLAATEPRVLARLPLDGGPALVARLWFDRILALAGSGDSRLLLFDLETLRITDELRPPGPVGGLLASPTGDRLFLLLEDPPRILGLDYPERTTFLLELLPGAPAMAVTADGATFCS